MARFDYTNIYNTAVSLINRFGALYTLKRLDSSYTATFDPDTGSQVWSNGTTTSTTPVYTESTADGVITDFTQEERTNTAIKVGDKKLLTVTITEPQEQDIFTIGSTDYSYVNHETIQPASTSDPLLYKIQLRV